MIFDRLGKKLYETTNYLNDWNGKDMDGHTLESGTYWYIITMPGIPAECKGFVYLKNKTKKGAPPNIIESLRPFNFEQKITSSLTQMLLNQ